MANFCMYCGKALEEGAVCDCQQPVQAPVQQQPVQQQPVQQQPVQVAPAKPSAIGEAFKNMWPFIKSYFTNPKEAIMNGAKKEMVLSIIFTSIFALVFIIAKFLNIADYAVSIDGFKVSIPIIQPILAGIVDAALWVGLSTLVLFVTAKIVGSTVDIKDAFVTAGLQTFVPAALVLLSGICAFIDGTFAAYIYNLAVIIWTVTLALDIINYLGSVTDSGKKFITTLAAIGIAIGLFTFVSGKLDTWTYENVELKSVAYDDIMDYADDFADALEDFGF